ncbi:hypothetical protein B0H10DRAFT_2244061 [Mycena sp. CBHHK59/15]|nr:hypothetical protein B0H10DRAFT_2244061 [Mycena sp. CBHHK59/15]
MSAQPYIHDAMSKKLPGWEHEGWVGVPHRKQQPALRIGRNAKRAARVAKRAAKAPSVATWDLSLPPDMALPGLSLQGNRQKTFYRSIHEEKTKKLIPQASTTKNLEAIRLAVYNAFDRRVTDTQIW